MKLIGISLATGTNALVAAINYEGSPKRLPHVRVNSKINDIDDIDNVLILGASKKSRDFHILAQVHNDNARAIVNSSSNRNFTTHKASLIEETGVSPFAAYIEGMPHVD